MEILRNPSSDSWSEIAQRPSEKNESIESNVKEILNQVKVNGDQSLYDLTQKFDGVQLNDLTVSQNEIEAASQMLDDNLKSAIRTAAQNIETFHQSQTTSIRKIETMPGVTCWRKSVGIEKVGLYIPGGTAPLFSTVLMLGIPARIANCKEVILSTPADKNGNINPAILFTADLVGITKIYKVGGAQAIGAMAYGTESITKVDKIFGPGNQYVTKAKEFVQMTGTAIDMPAGPSEVLVIADESANPEFVAADLLSQAEHGTDSQVILLTTSERVLRETKEQIQLQLDRLPRKSIAKKALANSQAILFGSLQECMNFSNAYAPEHLIIATENGSELVDKVVNAGSVFLGNYSCESAGDYASGTNHTLPTAGFARNYSGVSVDSFTKKITFQELTETGIQNIGRTVELMAEAEGLSAHKNAVSVRLKSLKS